MRNAEIRRTTNETDIYMRLGVDGRGISHCETGCGFLDHMLTLFTRHGRFDMDISCKGDTYVDYHHSVEDIGICLGRAFREALGECRGIRRYADITLPMDEALILVSVDISGRGALYYSAQIDAQKVGDFDTELCEEFFIALAREAGMTLHIKQLSGSNAHHIIEGMFKAVARVLREAVSIEAEYAEEIPSTKGVL